MWISGHPSVTGRAQDRESSPAKDRRSTTVPRHQRLKVADTSGRKGYIENMKLVYHRGTALRVMSVQIMSPDIQMYEQEVPRPQRDRATRYMS